LSGDPLVGLGKGSFIQRQVHAASQERHAPQAARAVHCPEDIGHVSDRLAIDRSDHLVVEFLIADIDGIRQNHGKQNYVVLGLAREFVLVQIVNAPGVGSYWSFQLLPEARR